jgi:hypothetical protein
MDRLSDMETEVIQCLAPQTGAAPAGGVKAQDLDTFVVIAPFQLGHGVVAEGAAGYDRNVVFARQARGKIRQHLARGGEVGVEEAVNQVECQ